jgi:hypothetical protein
VVVGDGNRTETTTAAEREEVFGSPLGTGPRGPSGYRGELGFATVVPHDVAASLTAP